MSSWWQGSPSWNASGWKVSWQAWWTGSNAWSDETADREAVWKDDEGRQSWRGGRAQRIRDWKQRMPPTKDLHCDASWHSSCEDVALSENFGHEANSSITPCNEPCVATHSIDSREADDAMCYKTSTTICQAADAYFTLRCFCLHLPKDSFSDGNSVIYATKPVENQCFVTTIKLVPPCPILGEFHSDHWARKEVSQQHAALQVVKFLHQKGLLDEELQPVLCEPPGGVNATRQLQNKEQGTVPLKACQNGPPWANADLDLGRLSADSSKQLTLIAIEASFAGGASDTRFGLLVINDDVNKMMGKAYWDLEHGVSVQLQFDAINWPPELVGNGAPSSYPEACDLLRSYHKATYGIDNWLPDVLLVQFNRVRDGACKFAWQAMKDVVTAAAGSDSTSSGKPVLAMDPPAEIINLESVLQSAPEKDGQGSDDSDLDADFPYIQSLQTLQAVLAQQEERRPDWLLSALHRWSRLCKLRHIWEEYLPVALEAVPPVLGPATNFLENSGLVVLGDTFPLEHMLGMSILRVLIALQVFVQSPFAHEVQLEQLLDANLGQGWAAFSPSHLVVSLHEFLAAALPTVDHHPRTGATKQQQHQKGMQGLHALLAGVWNSAGGDFSGAWRLWKCSTFEQQREGGPFMEDAVLGSFLFGKNVRFGGRTPSYIELQELLSGDGVDARTLSVHYNDNELNFKGHISYIRATNQQPPMECKGKVRKPLCFSHALGTFVSSFITDAVRKPCPLPNKVASWIFGSNLAAMIKIKPCKNPTPEYLWMQELDNGRLRVCYKELGKMTYERASDGGLGKEQKVIDNKEGGEIIEEAQLIYAENLKTFKSSLIRDAVLPHVIVKWLTAHTALVDLAQPKPSHHEPDAVDENSRTEQSDDNSLLWKCDGRMMRIFGVRCLFGVVFLESEIVGSKQQKAEPLIFSEELGSWLSPTLTCGSQFESQRNCGVRLPTSVVAWLLAFRRSTSMPSGFTAQWLHTPWVSIPSHIKALAHRKGNLAEFEAKFLNYTFRNPLLLVEAVTHSSFTDGPTVSCSRLAFLGEHLITLLVITTLSKRKIHTPAAQLRKLWFAACNHLTYAYACIQIGLHNHCRFHSAELGDAMRHFERFVRQAQKESPGELWHQLIIHDAPRILGDMFIAVVAAAFLDSDWAKMCQMISPIVEEHILGFLSRADDDHAVLDPEMHAYEMAAERGVSLELLDGDVNTTTNNEIMESAQAASERHVFFQEVCMCGSEENTDLVDAGNKRQRQIAFAQRDFSICRAVLGGISVAPPSMATSPRSSSRRCCYGLIVKNAVEQVAKIVPVGGEQQDQGHVLKLDDLSLDSPLVEGGGDEASDSASVSLHEDIQAASKESNDAGAVYCEDCEMWLNGPTQWEDHKIGKKHKKNLKKVAVNKGGTDHKMDSTWKGKMTKAATSTQAHGHDYAGGQPQPEQYAQPEPHAQPEQFDGLGAYGTFEQPQVQLGCPMYYDYCMPQVQPQVPQVQIWYNCSQ